MSASTNNALTSRDQRSRSARERSALSGPALLIRCYVSWTVVTFFTSAALFAQESDTAILKGDQSTYTILSDVKDPQERNLFSSLYNTSNPLARHQLAERFLSAYPQSWLLSQVYDVAAKASLDLGSVQQAMEEGRFSLRLLPENPTLLVLMANAEAQAQQIDRAIADARYALECLDQFAQAGAYSDKQWSSLKLQLKASAYFALGRAWFARALQEPASPAAPLAAARDALEHAAACNPEDPEIFYLRALVEIKANDKTNALRDLAFVARSPDPLHTQAVAAFRRLSPGDDPASQPKPALDESLRSDPRAAKPTPAILEGYAGSEACQSCHAREYRTWRLTGMARMLRPYKPENIMGDFSSGAAFDDESGNPVVRMGIDSRPYFEILARDGAWQRFPVDYTIGSKWQQAYATERPDGTLQVIPIQYNALQNKWVNYWKIIDPPGSKRSVVSNFPALQPATNYQQNCAICHTSQLRAASGAAGPLEHAEFREPGIDCEMCHGPAAWHVKRMRAGELDKTELLEPPVDFRKIDQRSGVQVCAQCHRQSSIREIGDKQEMNYSSTTGAYVPSSWSRPYDAFSRRGFFKDGRFRETTFIVEAFTRSACYRKGIAQCASCHSPHESDSKDNLTSVKFRSNSDELCLGCHSQLRSRISAHTHHAAGSEASRCVSCHMPRIVNALLFKARSHQIDIPSADLTLRFGQEDSPNACQLCHLEKDAAWTASKLERWKD
jgi:predicted CXXCH cytochrome family protein